MHINNIAKTVEIKALRLLESMGAKSMYNRSQQMPYTDWKRVCVDGAELERTGVVFCEWTYKPWRHYFASLFFGETRESVRAISERERELVYDCSHCVTRNVYC